jgi:ABC-2 type transport system permease protein
MNAFLTHFAIEFRMGLRNRNALLMTYLFPLGFYLLVSGFMTRLNPYFKDNVITAMVSFAVLSGVMLGLPAPLITYRETGVFRSYKVNGVPAASILLIPVIASLVHTVIVAFIIALTAGPLFQAPLPANWLGFVGYLLLLAAALSGIALLIGVVAANTRVSILASQLIYLPSILLGGVMVPSSVVTGGFMRIGLLMPTSYAISFYNGVARPATPLVPALPSAIILLAGTAVSFLLALLLFSWDRQNPGRKARPALAILAFLPYAIGAVIYGGR